MKTYKDTWLSFGAPLLILLSISGFLQRKGNERAQVFPAFAIGSSLILSSAVGHCLKRKKLLFELKKKNDDN